MYSLPDQTDATTARNQLRYEKPILREQRMESMIQSSTVMNCQGDGACAPPNIWES